MKNKKKIFGASILFLLVTFLLVALFFNLQVQSQDMYLTGAGEKTELTTGSWVLTDVSSQSYNSDNVTKWNNSSNEIIGECSWKDILDIIHTVNSGFRWDEPPKTMKPGKFLDIQADYINNEYSTPCKVNTGIRMFIDRVGANYLASNSEAIEIIRVLKDNKQYGSEQKKGFFNAPKTLFDESGQCQLIVDCFIGKDHFVTKYTYTYRP